MRVFKKNPLHTILSSLTPVLFTGIIVVGMIIGLGEADDASRSEGVRLLQEALHRVAVHSYAVNGQFPESLAYIEENYSVFIDRTRFVVVYNIFASNMMPVIQVFELD